MSDRAQPVCGIVGAIRSVVMEHSQASDFTQAEVDAAIVGARWDAVKRQIVVTLPARLASVEFTVTYE